MERKRTPTRKILKALVDSLAFEFQITSVTDNLDGTYTLTTCNTYHLQPSYEIEIDGVTYKIESVEKDINIVITGTPEPTALTFDCYVPHFFHGTPMQASNELTEIVIASEITPLVFLSEADGDFKERYLAPPSSIDRESKVTLYFLTQCNPEDWKTEDYHTDAFEPMTALALEFITKCRKSKLIGDFKEFEIQNKGRVGVTTNGARKANFANKHLSGVQLTITLPIEVEACRPSCDQVIIVVPSGYTFDNMLDPIESYTQPFEFYT